MWLDAAEVVSGRSALAVSRGSAGSGAALTSWGAVTVLSRRSRLSQHHARGCQYTLCWQAASCVTRRACCRLLSQCCPTGQGGRFERRVPLYVFKVCEARDLIRNGRQDSSAAAVPCTSVTRRLRGTTEEGLPRAALTARIGVRGQSRWSVTEAQRTRAPPTVSTLTVAGTGSEHRQRQRQHTPQAQTSPSAVQLPPQEPRATHALT